MGPQLLDGPLHAGRDLAGLLVADGLRQLRSSVGERAQRVPTRDDVLRRARDGVESVAQRRGGRLEILREDDLLLALEGPRAADLLEVRLQRPPLAAGIQLVGGDGARGTGGGARGALRALRRLGGLAG